jgi:aspartyl-tRNA(Asn)/glutamyl-tRNA(Gln) amidotransferase subunit C
MVFINPTEGGSKPIIEWRYHDRQTACPGPTVQPALRTLNRRSESVRLSAFVAWLAPECWLIETKGHKPMSLSIADVAKVAILARLRLSPEELETFTGQLNSIVDYVAQLQELDTTGVEPLAHGIELRNVFRDDVRGPALELEQALANAPKRNRENFLVPAVLE